MIICQSCRAENWDGAQFCDECGKPLPRTGAYARAQSFKPPSEQESRPPEPRTPAVGGAGNNSAPGVNNNASGVAGAPNAAPGGENGSRAVLSFPEPSAPVGPSVRAGAGGGAAAGTDARRTSVKAHARLTINRGRAAGKEFPVHEDEAYIGRWDADSGIFPDVDLDADDPEAKVSRRHARITRRGEQYFIEDLGSTNGTFINRGRRLLPGDRQPLNDGDEIIIGKTFLRFQIVK
ncbi:MAG: FHA domain-containing protein [Pyrinomonadaceae bacterium]